MPTFIQKYFIIQLLSIFLTQIEPGMCDDRRPVYIIGHAANSIEDVISHLNNGANALESDVQFFSNGSVKEILHGCASFHDCHTPCDKHVQMPKYFKYIRSITDPAITDTYYSQLILQMLDLKLSSSKNLRESGREIARHIFEYLWSKGNRPQEVKVVFCFNAPAEEEAVGGFIQEFRDRGQESRLQDVGFDGGTGDITVIGKTFKNLKLGNIWFADGILNCLRDFRPITRLEEALKVRDSGGYIKKVYDWTVDGKHTMRRDFDLEVDGFITNHPRNAIDVLQEKKYKNNFRLATKKDPPFKRFKG